MSDRVDHPALDCRRDGNRGITPIARTDGAPMKGKSKQFVVHDSRGDMVFSGGAGYGEKQEKTRGGVRRDLALGYVCAGFATEHHGITQEETDAVLANAKHWGEF